MEKRLVLAVLLMGAVILVTNLLFPPQPPDEVMLEEEIAAPGAVQPPTAPAFRAPPVAEPAVGVDTITVTSPLYRYAFSTRGAALVRAEMLNFSSYTHPDQPVQLVPEQTLDFLAHRVVVGRDTIDLRDVPFRVDGESATLQEGDAPHQLRFVYGDEELGAEIIYTFQPTEYLVGVQGRVFGLQGAGATLLTELGPRLEVHEHPAHRSEDQLAVVARNGGRVNNLRLRNVRGEEVLPGPFVWTGVRDKYFLASLVAGDGPRFERVIARELPADPEGVPHAEVTTLLPLGATGEFAFAAYLGPQEHGRLVAVGHGLQEVNPYGYRWLAPVIRPIAAAILWVLDLFHTTFGIGYGWVLVLFGVLMRIVLWPLNAKAMRAQLKNMAVQPLMQEIREKHKDDPQRMQQEMMKLYKEHGFNPLAGCLPLLVPMPVLITLFFVFQDSIAFRGESFYWLPDLSLADPYYILPVFLVISMFALQFLSARLSGMEHNPQMKMMMYIMPLAIGFIFFMLPSGLNLYYATTNVATIPQQVLIAKERKKAQEALKQEEGSKRGSAPVAAVGGSGKKKKGSRAKRRS